MKKMYILILLLIFIAAFIYNPAGAITGAIIGYIAALVLRD